MTASDPGAGPAARQEVWRAVLAERPRAERVARSRCASVHDAEDCVQEAMARVAAMPDVDLTRVGPLLGTVVANLAADGHRARARAARAEPRLVAGAFAPSPEEEVCDVLEARWLWGRRSALPDQDRAVLELRAQGRSASQAAAELGLTYKAAESAFTRARAKMRAIWRAAAVLGILSWRPTRQAGTAGAMAAVAATALLAGLALPHPPGPGAPARDPAAQEQVPGALVGAPPAQPRATTVVTAPRISRGRALPPSTPRAVAPAPVPAAAPVLEAQAVVVGPVESGETSVYNRRPDETLVETVQRCLRRGVIARPDRVGCAD